MILYLATRQGRHAPMYSCAQTPWYTPQVDLLLCWLFHDVTNWKSAVVSWVVSFVKLYSNLKKGRNQEKFPSGNIFHHVCQTLAYFAKVIIYVAKCFGLNLSKPFLLCLVKWSDLILTSDDQHQTFLVTSRGKRIAQLIKNSMVQTGINITYGAQRLFKSYFILVETRKNALQFLVDNILLFFFSHITV